MEKEYNYGSIYNSISSDSLELIKKLNLDHKCTFLIPTRFISKENAQLAYLLNEYYNIGKNTSERQNYRSFFVNSRYEAIQGAIKLMRHNGIKKKREKIIVMDLSNELKFLFNPLDKVNERDYLIPNIKFVYSLEEVNSILKTERNLLGIILINSNKMFPTNRYFNLIEKCKSMNILSLWVDYKHSPGEPFSIHKMKCLPDMIVVGEGFTDSEIPFSIFSMTEKVHKPWTSMSNSLLHSSTYSGNKLSVLKARNVLLKKVLVFKDNEDIKKKCDDIDSNINLTMKYFSNYINPGMVNFYNVLGYNFLCKKAFGSNIIIHNKSGDLKTLLDAVSGGGAAINGHAPEDIYENVIKKHNNDVDYFNILEKKFKELFQFPYTFPAISGATAVENAFILSLLAAMGKKRIITFENNYAGNTLISLIGTGYSDIHKIFHPNYQYISYINPFDKNAKEQLITELEKGDVALVWMEVIQGSTLHEIPKDILDVIQENKKRLGYFIGIDEILMGFYRVKKVASFKDMGIQPDIITFSKALTDGTFPIGATLVSESIYEKAVEQNEDIVMKLKSQYKNQFGAHIALNSLDKILNHEAIERYKSVSQILENGMQEIQKKVPYIKNIDGKGHIYCLNYKNDMLSYYFCKRAIDKENLFMYIDRIVLSVNISPEEARELLKKLENLYKNVGNPFIFRLKSIFITVKLYLQFLFI